MEKEINKLNLESNYTLGFLYTQRQVELYFIHPGTKKHPNLHTQNIQKNRWDTYQHWFRKYYVLSLSANNLVTDYAVQGEYITELYFIFSGAVQLREQTGERGSRLHTKKMK